MLVAINPAGPVHTVFNCMSPSVKAGLNTTVQVRGMSVPIGLIGFDMLLVTTTDVGAGTVKSIDL